MGLHQEYKVIVLFCAAAGAFALHQAGLRAPTPLFRHSPWILAAPTLVATSLSYIADCPWLALRKRLRRRSAALLVVLVHGLPFLLFLGWLWTGSSHPPASRLLWTGVQLVLGLFLLVFSHLLSRLDSMER